MAEGNIKYKVTKQSDAERKEGLEKRGAQERDEDEGPGAARSECDTIIASLLDLLSVSQIPGAERLPSD